ncbi:MAG TPA: O-antigen ligase family protein, partial [Cryptosporangiaceae bacterium]|nr:O-antigen ligase family protein [Cryptosporangiaceae bacterium]
LLFAVALVLTASASTLISVNVEKSAKVAATFALGLLLVLAVVIVARTGEKQRVLLGAAVIGSLAVTVPVLGTAKELVASYGGAVVDNRAISTFVDPNALGSYTAMVLFLAIGWGVSAKNRWERLGALVGGVAALAALTLTLSRGAWIGTLIGLVVFTVLHPRTRRPLVLTSVAVATAALLFLVAAPGIGGPAAVVVDRVISIGNPNANPYDVRPITWGEAVRQYANAPALGNGPGAFSVLSAESPSALQFQPRRHAHNGVLTTAAEMGTIGLFTGLGFVLTLGLAIWGRVRRLQAAHRYSELGVLAGGASALVALSVHLFVDYPLRNPVLMVFVWTLAGLMLAVAATPSAPRMSAGAGAGRALSIYATRQR